VKGLLFSYERREDAKERKPRFGGKQKSNKAFL